MRSIKKSLLTGCAALAFLNFGISKESAAQDNPMDWLIESNPGGSWRNYGDTMLIRRHDFGGDAQHPLGYAASDDVYCGDNTACNTWQYSGNGAFNAAAGDGGQVVIVEQGGSHNVYVTETQDGTYNGMQYFVGPACGAAGWKLFDDSVMNGPTGWNTEVDQLRISFVGPNDCAPLSNAYTAWMRGSAEMPYQSQGQPAGSLYLPVIVTEHNDCSSPGCTINKEVDIFVKNIGWTYWLAYSRTAIPGDELATRCPQITVTGANGNTWMTDQTALGFHLVDCRYYMNYVPVPLGWNLNAFGWLFNR